MLFLLTALCQPYVGGKTLEHKKMQMAQLNEETKKTQTYNFRPQH